MLDSTIDQRTAEAAANTGAVLYASAETRQQLGWVADRLPQWAGQDIILISRQDLATALPRDVLNTFPRMQELLSGTAPFPGQITERQEAALETSLRAHFNKVGLPEAFLNPVSPHPEIESVTLPSTAYDLLAAKTFLGSNSLLGNAAALPQQIDILDPNSGLARPWNICVVMMPDMAMTPSEIGGMLGSLPAHNISMPGTARDWQALILSHEADHCSTMAKERAEGKADIDRDVLALEIVADQTALNMVRTEHALGNITTPDIARAFADVRAIGAIMRADIDHTTSPAIDPHGDKLAMQPRRDEISVAVNDAEKAQPSSPGSSLSVLEDMMERMKIQQPPPNTISTTDVMGLHAKLFDFLVKEAGMATTDTMIMGNLMNEDPALVFETVRFLSARGDFEDNPAQQRLADQFIAAADRIAPHIFETRIPGPFLVEEKPAATAGTPDTDLAPSPVLPDTPRILPLPRP